MGLESTMICLDNSEWMRNGDYIPTRMEAQHDAANMLCGAKTQANPESTVGILSMAGKRVELLVSPTDDMGKILNGLHNIAIGGECRFANAIRVAQLALKHRREKKGAQRLVIFVASPIVEDEKTLTKIGKLLKKNNIAVDVMSFGDIDSNEEKLKLVIEAANSNNNCHYVSVPQGALPSDVLISSPIIHGGNDGGGSAAGGGGGGASSFAEYGGIDPSMDPELALALRVSMEEERARQEASQKANGGEDAAGPSEPKAAAQVPSTAGSGEDDELQRALQLSMQEATGSAATATTTESSDTKEAPPPAPAASSGAAFLDPSFVNNLLSGLPGVDPNDPKIQAAMAQLNKSEDKKDGEKKDDEKKK